MDEFVKPTTEDPIQQTFYKEDVDSSPTNGVCRMSH